VEALFDYVEVTIAPVYRDVLRQLSSGRISLGALEYLVKPGDVVVRPKPSPTAFIATRWLTYQGPAESPRNHAGPRVTFEIDATGDGGKDNIWGSLRQAEGARDRSPVAREERDDSKPSQPKTSDREPEEAYQIWTVIGWNWEIKHGQLSRRQEVLELRIDPSSTEPLDITSLEWYPLRYASQDIKSLLLKRGHTFWQCRERRFVGYSDQGSEAGDLDSVRCLSGPNSLSPLLTRYYRRPTSAS
jgi:hypothetical protein